MGIQQKRQSKLKKFGGFLKRLFSRVTNTIKRAWTPRIPKKKVVDSLSQKPVTTLQLVEQPVPPPPVAEAPVIQPPVVEAPPVELPVPPPPVAEAPVIQPPVIEAPPVELPVPLPLMVETIVNPPEKVLAEDFQGGERPASAEPISDGEDKASILDKVGTSASFPEEPLDKTLESIPTPILTPTSIPPTSETSKKIEEDYYHQSLKRLSLIPEGKKKGRQPKLKEKPPSPKKVKIPIYDTSHLKHYYRLSPKKSTSKDQIPEKTQKESRASIILKEKPFVIIDLEQDELFLVVPLSKIFKENSQISLFYYVNEEDCSKIDRNGDLSEQENSWDKKLLIKPVKNYNITIHLGNQPSYGFKYSSDTTNWYFFKETASGALKLLNNPEKLPRKLIWVLLATNYVIQNANIREKRERMYWDGYHLFQFDLTNISKLEIKNSKSGVLESIPVESTFEIVGDFLQLADTPDYIHVITNNYLQLREKAGEGEDSLDNREYNVEITLAAEKRQFFYSEIWANNEDLTIDLSKNGLKAGGDYQLAVMEKGERKSTWVCGFKWLPFFEINFPSKEVFIIPDLQGHTSFEALITIPKPQELINVNPPDIKFEKFEEKQSNFNYKLDIPINIDDFRLEVGDPVNAKYQTEIPLTLKRVRWKLGEQEDWEDKRIKVQKEELVPGKDHILLLKNFENARAKANLVLNGKILQELKLTQEKDVVFFKLNSLFDTMRQYRYDLLLEIYLSGQEKNQKFIPIIFENEFRTLESIELSGLLLENYRGFQVKKLFELFSELCVKFSEFNEEFQEICNSFTIFTPSKENDEIQQKREILFQKMLLSLRNQFKKNNWINENYRDIKIWRRIFAHFQE